MIFTFLKNKLKAKKYIQPESTPHIVYNYFKFMDKVRCIDDEFSNLRKDRIYEVDYTQKWKDGKLYVKLLNDTSGAGYKIDRFEPILQNEK